MTSRPHLRLVSWNIFGARGWLPGEHPDHAPASTRRHVQRHIAHHLAQHSPDIVALQECPSRSITDQIAECLGMHLAWFSAGWEGNDVWPGGFPGALLSRYPMRDVRHERQLATDLPSSCFQRHWGSAVLHVPPAPVRVHAYHCCADWDGQNHEAVRVLELQRVVACVDPHEPTILVGDHNTRPGELPLAALKTGGFVEAHEVAGKGKGHSDPAHAPMQRIDQCWIKGLAPLRSRVLAGTKIWTQDHDVGFYLSDHGMLVIDLRLEP